MNEYFIEFEKNEWEIVGDGLRRKILGYDDLMMMVLVDFEVGAIGQPHKHPHRQVTYVAKGRFETVIGNTKKILKQGDSFFVPPNILHEVRCLEKGSLVDVFSPYREDFLKK